MFKKDLELDNLLWLICHKTKPNHKYAKNANTNVQRIRFPNPQALNNIRRVDMPLNTID